jgi:hypothetical protein
MTLPKSEFIFILPTRSFILNLNKMSEKQNEIELREIEELVENQMI